MSASQFLLLLCQNFGVGLSIGLILFFLMISKPVSKKICAKNSPGIGIRKSLVLEEVFDLVSVRFFGLFTHWRDEVKKNQNLADIKCEQPLKLIAAFLGWSPVLFKGDLCISKSQFLERR